MIFELLLIINYPFKTIKLLTLQKQSKNTINLCKKREDIYKGVLLTVGIVSWICTYVIIKKRIWAK